MIEDSDCNLRFFAGKFEEGKSPAALAWPEKVAVPAIGEEVVILGAYDATLNHARFFKTARMTRQKVGPQRAAAQLEAQLGRSGVKLLCPAEVSLQMNGVRRNDKGHDLGAGDGVDNGLLVIGKHGLEIVQCGRCGQVEGGRPLPFQPLDLRLFV